MKLTTAIARNLEPPSGKTDHIEWAEDFPGFGVRLRVGSKRISRNWVYQYNIGRRTRRIALGNVNAIGIDDARKTAGQLQGMVQLGRDPVGEKAESRARAADTFASVVRNYLMMAKLRLRARSYRSVEYDLRYCESLFPLPFTAITRREIAAVLNAITARGARRQSNIVRARLSAVFNWAISQGLTESNPVVGTIKHEQKPRERVLSLSELTAIWHVLDDVHSLVDYSTIIRLLMLTGQRRGEIGDLHWSEVVDDAIVLPGKRTKNGLEHRVPLSKPVQTILAARRRGSDDDFVFWRRSNDQLRGWARPTTSLARALTKRGYQLAPWVVHDLRRSVATHMGEMGIQPHVIETVLNHAGGFRAGVAGTYNRSKLEDQKRQALTAWGELLMAHVEGRAPAGAKIVSFAALGR